MSLLDSTLWTNCSTVWEPQTFNTIFSVQTVSVYYSHVSSACTLLVFSFHLVTAAEEDIIIYTLLLTLLCTWVTKTLFLLGDTTPRMSSQTYSHWQFDYPMSSAGLTSSSVALAYTIFSCIQLIFTKVTKMPNKSKICWVMFFNVCPFLVRGLFVGNLMKFDFNLIKVVLDQQE